MSIGMQQDSGKFSKCSRLSELSERVFLFESDKCMIIIAVIIWNGRREKRVKTKNEELSSKRKVKRGCKEIGEVGQVGLGKLADNKRKYSNSKYLLMRVKPCTGNLSEI